MNEFDSISGLIEKSLEDLYFLQQRIQLLEEYKYLEIKDKYGNTVENVDEFLESEDYYLVPKSGKRIFFLFLSFNFIIH